MPKRKAGDDHEHLPRVAGRNQQRQKKGEVVDAGGDVQDPHVDELRKPAALVFIDVRSSSSPWDEAVRMASRLAPDCDSI